MAQAVAAIFRAMRPLVVAALGGVALTACLPSSPGTSLVPEQRPQVLPAAYRPPSVESAQLRNYYRVLQQDLLTRGLLRTDGGGPETAEWSLTGDTVVDEGGTASYTLALDGILQLGEVATVDLALTNIGTTSGDYAAFAAVVQTAIGSRTDITFSGSRDFEFSSNQDQCPG